MSTILNNQNSFGQYKAELNAKSDNEQITQLVLKNNNATSGNSLIVKINNTTNKLFNSATDYAKQLLTQGQKAATEANFSQQQINTIKQANNSPIDTPKAKTFIESKLVSYIEKELKSQLKLDNKTMNALKEFIAKIKEKGSFVPQDFIDNPEIQSVLNNDQSMKDIFQALTKGTDYFMDFAKEKMQQGSRKSTMRVAQEALDLSALLMKGMKNAVATIAKNESLQFRGLAREVNVYA